ncbi:MAG: exodeoxyribonuclease V subunit alpha [Burkholderiaceae bacterium]|nr:exodeoxyribonuclease V subunit alpha [Burkholderiaceae bacterium]
MARRRRPADRAVLPPAGGGGHRVAVGTARRRRGSAVSTIEQVPEAALAEGFARQVQRWATARGASPPAAAAVAAAARAVSLATSDGHVCLDLAEWLALPPGADPAPDRAAWRQRLLGSGLVGTPQQPGVLPLILDAADRLYLHRYFDFERRLAQRLVRCIAAPNEGLDEGLDGADTAALLTRLFGADAVEPSPDWQRLAAALALRKRLTVISGGPGTGKTTTVVNLLACVLAGQPGSRIALAAPTGKAAARLAEALRQRAGHLDEPLRRLLPDEAFTVHRLLGVRPEGSPDAADGPFVHHAGNRLPLDLLVVDEASMLDLALATRLLEAVPDSARIVLLGDKDQLAAVAAGAVFAELGADPSLSPACREQLGALCAVAPSRIVPAAPLQPSVLADSVVWFDRNFRFAADSGIGRLAADTVAGRSDALLGWLRAGADASVQWLADADETLTPAMLAAIDQGFAGYLAALRAGLADADAPARITEAFGAFRVLCALQDGPRGVAAVNQAVGRRVVQALGEVAPRPDPRSAWFTGRPVMVLRNDAALKLFNGDIGITLPGADGALQVVFPAADGGFRALSPLRLPPHQTAFAMTVHKSQGSEFDAVLVLLPARQSRVLSRELVYTAVTRARRRVALAAPAPVLAAALQAVTRRHSGLLDRLREAVAATAGAAATVAPAVPPV